MIVEQKKPWLRPHNTLKEVNLAAKKHFGQNFLTDDFHLSKIAYFIDKLSVPASAVFEIGAGLGALTNKIIQGKNSKFLLALERDRDLVPILRESFKESIKQSTMEVVQDDVLRFDFVKYIDQLGGEKIVLCGNLPYHLTSSIIFKALELREHIRGCVFLVQKEVAQRIVADCGCRTYGILSVLVQTIFEPKLVHLVPRGAFFPAPKVDSAVITFEERDFTGIDCIWQDLLIIVKKAFNQRRKMLVNSLSEYDIATALTELGISPKARAEQLSPQQFVSLSKMLIK